MCVYVPHCVCHHHISLCMSLPLLSSLSPCSCICFCVRALREATIEDAYRKTVRVDEEVSVVEILDTAGQEDFSSLRPQWMQDKDGYLFVYSLVDRASLQEMYSFIELLEQVGYIVHSVQYIAYSI